MHEMYNKITKRVENIHECSIISDVMFRDFEEEGGIRMNKRWRYVATAMLLCVMTIAASITSLAATKTISSVTIRVGTDIEAGEEAMKEKASKKKVKNVIRSVMLSGSHLPASI